MYSGFKEEASKKEEAEDMATLGLTRCNSQCTYLTNISKLSPIVILYKTLL